MPWSLLLNKYVLAGIACLLLAVGCSWGIESIHSAYTERAALAVKVAAQDKTITADEQAIVTWQTATVKAETDKKALVDEIKLRDDIQKQNDARNLQLTKDLKNAQSTVAKWKKSASTTVQSCFSVPLPVGLFGDASQATTAAGNAH